MLNINRDDLKQLKNTDADMLTLYLHVSPGHQPNQNTPPAWQIFLKNELRRIEDSLPEGQQSGWQNVKSRVEQLVAGYSPGGKTLVAFISPDDTTLYELPVTLDNAAAYGAPLLPPLLWAIDEYERYLIALVDQERARFFTAYLGNATQPAETTLDPEDHAFGERTQMPASGGAGGTGGAGAQGYSLGAGNNREQYEDMIAAHVERFHKSVAKRLQELVTSSGAARIILGGAERAMHAVHDELDTDNMKQPVLLVESLTLDASDSEVVNGIRQQALNYERSYENDLVEDVIGSAKAQGHGATGYDNVQAALNMQGVDLLLLPWPAQDPAEAAAMTLQALDSGATIELVHGSAANKLQNEGGVAARLYFPLPTQ